MAMMRDYLHVDAHTWSPPFVVTERWFIYSGQSGKTRRTIFLQSITNTARKEPITLFLANENHEQAVKSLSIDSAEQLLCSCSSDRVILWDIPDSSSGEDAWDGKLIGQDLGSVELCQISPNADWVAVATLMRIWILKLQFSDERRNLASLLTVDHHANLEGHIVDVTAMIYMSSNPRILLTVGRNSACNVWNIWSCTIEKQEGPITGKSVTCCSSDPSSNLVAFGTNSGQVLVYSVGDADGFPMRKNIVLDVDKIFNNLDEAMEKTETKRVGPVTVSCQPSWTQQLSQTTTEERVKLSSMVLATAFVPTGRWEEEGKDALFPSASTIRTIMSTGSYLVVASNVGICVLDSKSWEVLPPVIYFDNCQLDLKTVCSCYLSRGSDAQTVTCAIQTLHNRKRWHILSLLIHGTPYPENPAAQVVSSTTLDADSVLKCNLRFTTGVELPSCMKQSKKVKSSGYNTTPRMAMFGNKVKTKQTKSTNPKPPAGLEKLVPNYPIDSPPPIHLKDKCQLWKATTGGGTAFKLDFSSDGSVLACASNRRDIYVVPWEENVIFPNKEPFTLLGHDGAVNSVHFSADKRWLLSASEDHTARIWDWKCKKVFLTLHQGKACQVTKNQPVTQARFYYVDRFLLLASNENLTIHAYTLQKPGQKMVGKYPMKCQKVTCIAAANQFYSYVVACGCSDRHIRVMDLNVGSICMDILAGGVPHSLSLNEGSPAVSHPPRAYDLALTSSLFDGTRMWDLRTGRCVQAYLQHSAKSRKCRAALSPCARYVAASSEDKCVFVYDTRWATEKAACRVKGAGDVIMDVAFHPAEPALVAAALDGSLTTFLSQPT